MDLRNLLKNWRSGCVVTAPTRTDDATAGAAAELLQLGAQQRQRAQYADALHTLTRAIELKHDSGEAHHNLGLVFLEQGRFEDATDCFELATHFAPQLAAAHLDLSAALAGLARHDAAESACRRALELEPHLAVGWLRLGNLAKARGNLEQAVECYRAAIERDAMLADAHCQLALVLFSLGRYDESRASHTAALAIKPDFVEVHHNLGLLLLETGYPEEALVSFERALALRPESLPTKACVAHSLRDLGRLDAALACYDTVLDKQPQFGDAVINRCYARLMREEYAAGWREYGRRFAATDVAERGFPFREWQGEPLAGKRVLAYAEQGLGDEIMFASCLPELEAGGAQVILECNDRLAALFARSFPHAMVHGGRKDDDKGWLQKAVPVDYQVAIGSLPCYFRGSREAFPHHDGYLAADPGRIAAWRHRLGAEGDRLRVGIAWRGGLLRTRQFTRSIPLEQWLPLLQQPRAQFVSLQYGDAMHELAQLRDAQGVTLQDFGGALSDLDELAAVIRALDLVISVDNTVAHLAGALGQNVWVLLTCSPEWRYPRHGADMPWYPSARLFRQPRPRAWKPAIDQVVDALLQRATVKPHV